MRNSFFHYIARNNKMALFGAIVVLAIAITATAGPFLYPVGPLEIDLDSIKQPPSFDHPFGTDSKGRDILSRVIHGSRISLFISISAAGGALVIGLILGLFAGYFGGKLDMSISMITDIALAFPSLLLAIGITVVFSPGLYTVVIALSLVGWATFARLVRGLTLSYKHSLFVEASRSIGSSHCRILFRHILPNCASTLLVAFSLKLGTFILAESALSFLGLGVQPPTPTWGSMVGIDRIYIHSAPWMVIFPGLAIAVSTFAFNILGDALRDYLDPHVNV